MSAKTIASEVQRTLFPRLNMACMNLETKPDGFQKKSQAWFCTTGLPCDIIIEVDTMAFHLHKFPLTSKSGKLANLLSELSENDEGESRIQLHDVPGGAEAFEIVAKFCYGVNVELTVANVVSLRCAADYLQMTEEFGEGNLIAKTESFLNQVVLNSWNGSIRALKSCGALMPITENLQIVKKCIDSIATIACSDASISGVRLIDHLHNSGRNLSWNGINTVGKSRNNCSDWWYEDASGLDLHIYEELISTIVEKGLKPDAVAGAVMYYAKRRLPGLNRKQDGQQSENLNAVIPLGSALCESDQRIILESIESLLPTQKGVTSTRFLFGLLRLALILNASSQCKSSLERRIGLQLEEATLDDILIPNYSATIETLYDVDTIQQILDHFLMFNQRPGFSSTSVLSHNDGPLMGSPSLSPMMTVAKLMDGYLAEVAPDENLKPSNFQSLAESLPSYSRLLDDGLYRAIDIYLKGHSWLSEGEREGLCRIIDCQKLSIDACAHAAQNERLPLRTIVQVLFFEQLQLRTAIAGCFLVADNVDATRVSHNKHIREDSQGSQYLNVVRENWSNALWENKILNLNMDKMRCRVNELEKHCTNMKQEMDKLGKGKGKSNILRMFSRKLSSKLRSRIFKFRDAVTENQKTVSVSDSLSMLSKQSKHSRSSSIV